MALKEIEVSETIVVPNVALNENEVSETIVVPKVLFVVLSGRSWNTTGMQGLETWHRHVQGPNQRLLVATDVPLGVCVPNVFYQNGTNDYKDAQRRFLDAMLNVRMGENEYMFLVDDDAFVITHHVAQFLYTLHSSGENQNGVIFGQATCSRLCGGAGALFSPSALRHLRLLEDEIMDEFKRPETGY